ncbi:MAG: DUF5916 domain-containing protein [Gemmatimonadota bacterium]
MRLGILVAAAVLASSPATAQTLGGGPDGPSPGASAKRVYALAAVRLAGATEVTIDGRLDEPVWATAPVATDFTQTRPNPGDPAHRRTEARVLLDDGAIYIGMRMFDAPDSIASQLTRRDAANAFSDWAHVMIDSYHDRRTAFRFSVTPRGAKKDVLHYNDNAEDINWDAVWDVATSLDEEGWVAEFRIPLSQLRFSPDRSGGTWGINFGREIARSGEYSFWSPVLPSVGGFVSQAGELQRMDGLRPGRRLELMPYSVARLTAAPRDPGNPFYDAHAMHASLGADLRAGIGTNLTLTATVNPDFGQVEADPSVVNLSAYETFFPDKRPFFTEGSNLFSFDVGYDDGSGESLFYSRRIGRAPQRGVGVAGGWVDAPEATTILGAAKLSGRLASGWSVGVLDAVTPRETARLAAPGQPAFTEPVEPATNYFVGTLSRDFREGRSSVGFMATAVNRQLGAGDAFQFLRRSAYTAGLSLDHRFADDTWSASGFVGGSHIRGSAAAIERVQRAAGHYFQRPDADYLELDPTRTTLTGAVAALNVFKVGGGNLRGGVGGQLRTPGFEINDIGYQQDADLLLTYGNLRIHQFEPRGIFRSFNIGLNPSLAWSMGGEHTWAQIGSSANFELKSFWNGGWWIARRFSALNPGALRGGPAVYRPGSWQGNVWFNSDRRKTVALHTSLNGNIEGETDSWAVSVSPGLVIRPSSQLNLTVGPGFSRGHNTWQYVGQPLAGGERRYLVGALDQTTVSLTARINYTITPELSFEMYAQPFISGGDYSAFRTLGAARSRSFDTRFPRLTGDALVRQPDGLYRADTDGDGVLDVSFGNPDFNFRQMRGNAVLRWEYRPGSTVYLVWSQARTGYSSAESGNVFSFDRDVRRLFNRDDAFPTPVTNVFLIKFSYWLNP